MTANKAFTDPGWTDPDDAPDVSAGAWRAKFAAAPVKRGRPKAGAAKISTTLRLDPDILAHFKAGGPGWQSRINDTLRKATGLPR